MMKENVKEIFIVNTQQAEMYLQGGVHPKRLKINKDGRMTFVYNIEDTKAVWEQWKTKKFNLSQELKANSKV